MGEGIFIAGTDTGVGKTVVTALLKRYMRDQGIHTVTHKWVQTGADLNDDVACHRKVGGIAEGEHKFEENIVSYKYTFPGSPHLAALLEHSTINKEKIISDYHILLNNFDIVLVENSGGLLVPYDNRNTLFDIARELFLPVLLVTGNKLGAINHTLLTLNFLRSQNAAVLGIVFSDLSSESDPIINDDNPRAVESVSREAVIGRIPFSNDIATLYEAFKPIGEVIANRIGYITNSEETNVE